MFQHPRVVRVHIAQRAADPIPQLISKVSGATTEGATATTVNRNTRPTSANNDNGESTTRGRVTTSTNRALLGDPVSASDNPTPSSASPDNNNDSNSSQDSSDSPPTTTTNRNHGTSPQASKSAVVVTSSTMVTSTLSTAHSSSSSKSTSRTSSAASNSATSGASTGSDSMSTGMSTGGKIGLAIGIIAIIGAFALLAVFLMKKNRKKQREALAREEDEKRSADDAAAAAAKPTRVSAPNAPRLSLRPVSRLVPELMGGSRQRDTANQGNMLTTFSQSSHGTPDRSLSPSGNMQSSQTRDNPFTDPVNPFTDPEKAAATGPVRSPPSLGPPAAIGAAYQQPHGQAHELEDTRSMSQVSRPGTATGSFVPLDASPPAPSPAVATGPGPDQPQGTVYRVIMDFKPTMEDELELRQGSHVRLLHEYDDGWALCIRLDRTHQGVVPRTCLAGKPSKPRPGPGPNGSMNPASRSTTPNGMGPRLNVSPGPGSAGFRPASPGNPRQMGPGNGPHQGPPYPTSGPGAFNQAPRPLSPGPRQQQKRSESPGPYGAGGPQPMGAMSQRQRSNSESQPSVNQRQSPPGPSRLGPGPTSGPGFAM